MRGVETGQDIKCPRVQVVRDRLVLHPQFTPCEDLAAQESNRKRGGCHHQSALACGACAGGLERLLHSDARQQQNHRAHEQQRWRWRRVGRNERRAVVEAHHDVAEDRRRKCHQQHNEKQPHTKTARVEAGRWIVEWCDSLGHGAGSLCASASK